jgi:hypothetical protein
MVNKQWWVPLGVTLLSCYARDRTQDESVAGLVSDRVCC